MLVFDDERINPRAFCWFGAIPRREVDHWCEESGFALPHDLLEFWSVTGGGDLFESETVLRPNVVQPPNAAFLAGDDVHSRNNDFRGNGLPPHLLIFQVGAFVSAIDMRTRKYVTLGADYSVRDEFNTFDDWYTRTVRLEFGERYGLEIDRGSTL
ncbi:MAG: hypothetical protein ACRD3E_14740 [Terriglobales bacterium]